MADSIVPSEALDYLRKKNLRPAFSYRDVWNEEHAASFTVAKAMQLDVLSDIKSEVEKAVEQGETFDSFRKNLAPALMRKGWWGKKDMVDPATGETVTAQLGSSRRLKTIYDTNIWSAYGKGNYDRAMSSAFVEYLMYRIGYSQHHREQHVAWDHLVLPKGDSFWDTHWPPNGWGCHCWVQTLTRAKKELYERDGVPVPRMQDGSGGGTAAIKTSAPEQTYKIYENTRKGTIERIPSGIAPGFAWNQGKAGREYGTLSSIISKTASLSDEKNREFLNSIINNRIKRTSFQNFVENAFTGKLTGTEITPVGFIDRYVYRWLKNNTGIDVQGNTVIGLESRLVKGIKATRHGIEKQDAGILLDTMLFGRTYWYPNIAGNAEKDALIYLYPVDNDRWFRIAVRPVESVNGITAPFIRSVGYLENSVAENLVKQMIEIKSK